MRLGLRLLLGFFFLVGLATYFVLNVFVEEVKPGVRQVMEAMLVDEANVLAELAAEDLQRGELAHGALARTLSAAGSRQLDATVWQHRKTRVDLRVTVTDARGLVLYDSAGLAVGRDHSRWNDVQRTLRGRYGARSSPEHPGATSPTVMHVAAPIYAPASTPRQIIGVLTVSQPNRVVEPFIASGQQQIVRRGLWLIGASALVAGAMTWWLVTGIGRLRRYSLAVAAGEPVPPPAPRSDELGDLGRAMEQMRRKLEGKAYVEEYVQALTHEMKSPLAAIRGAAELVAEPLPEPDRRRFAEQIQAQERRLTETIDKLLALAEVEQRGWLEALEPLAPRALLAELAAGAEAKAKAAEVELELAASDDVPEVRGDGYLLRQALGNLLDNALAFAPAGSTIELAAERHGEGVRLEVRDRGPGIPEYARARVFERFYSLPRPSTGARSTGLGLPFSREVARLHGGSLELSERQGGGTTARLTLPLTTRAR